MGYTSCLLEPTKSIAIQLVGQNISTTRGRASDVWMKYESYKRRNKTVLEEVVLFLFGLDVASCLKSYNKN